MRSETETERRDAGPAAGEAWQLTATPDEPYYRGRGEQRRRWGAILLLIGVVWLVFAITSRGSLFGVGLTERSADLPAQSFTAARVVVTGAGDDITLVGWGEDEVRLEATRHGFGWNGSAAEDALAGVEVVTSQRGDTLTIEVRRPPTFGGFVGRSPHADLRLSLPTGVVVEAQTVSGEIAAEGLRGDATLGTVSGEIDTEGTEGALSLNTTSGDAEVSDHRGPLVANSISGDISASGDLADPHVETVSGDVRLEGVRGRVQIDTISGEISVRAARDAVLSLESTSGDIEVDGGLAASEESRINNISGDVRLALPAGGNLRVDAGTISGELRAELELRDLIEERRRLRGRLGDGAANLVIITTSGDVTIAGE